MENIFLLLGIAIFAGTLGAKLFQYMHIPQVVGYITIGLLLGKTGTGIISTETVAKAQFFNFFALGVIGFLIGGELHRNVFKKYGKQFFAILLSEGLGAFILVGLSCGTLIYIFTHQVAVSIALGLLLGSISSATAPAATVDVLWEYKTRGPLTTMIFAIVALDDGLALFLYAISVSIVSKLLSKTGETLSTIGHCSYEIFGAIAMGIGVGLVLNLLIRKIRDPEKNLTFIIGSLGIIIGISRVYDFDLILAAMALGATIANLTPQNSRRAFEIIERFAPPIFVLFFVFIGASLNVGVMPAWLWVIAGAFVLGRSFGKIMGANFGSRIAGAKKSVRKYLGICLFSQAGVAIGLAILAGTRFTKPLTKDLTMGDAIIMIVTATTFLVQIIGPPCVKLAVKKAGEIGLNITEEDLLESCTVAEVMKEDAPTFSENIPVAKMLPKIAETSAMTYPVVNADNKLLGIITIDSLKKSFLAEGLTEWLLAFDIMEPARKLATYKMILKEAQTRMHEEDIEYLPVVDNENSMHFKGMLERRQVRSYLSREILKRHKKASDD